MDDCTHSLNPRDNVHHNNNKNKLCIILFYFSNYENNKEKHIKSSYLRIKNCVIGISKIIYVSKQDKRRPCALGILYLYTAVYAGKLCEQA